MHSFDDRRFFCCPAEAVSALDNIKIGAAIGATAAMAGFYAFAGSKTASGPLIHDEVAGYLLDSALVGGAGGGGIGALIDRQITRHEVVYRAR
jgi:hypothetical protein